MEHFYTAQQMGFKWRPDRDDGVTGLGTFTDYTSLDDPYMRTLHTHFMFLKFGFGRGSHEATGEIRARRMLRNDGVEMALTYDDYDCQEFLHLILELFDMTTGEFCEVVDRHANRAILERGVNSWVLQDRIHHNILMDNAIEIDYDGSY
jgi:hypothetical protein